MALKGIRVIELAGLAPGPFAGMVLADFGANVIRVDRTRQTTSTDVLSRGKRSIAIDLKKPSGCELLRKMIQTSDVVIEPFRPGVMEKLGLGPDVFLGEKGIAKSIVYSRVAGFNKNSKYKDMAGHDLNYIALSGVLSMLPGETKPSFPLNLLADFAGGGAMSVLGILAALISRSHIGRGQVVEVDMVSGSRYISSFPLIHAVSQSPYWNNPRGRNILDDGAPFYSIYQCAKDASESTTDQYMTVACLEPQFFREFISIFKKHIPVAPGSTLSGASDENLQIDRKLWPQLRQYLKDGFSTKMRDEWTAIYHGTDACTVPMLSPIEAARLSYDENPIPFPHPTLSHTPANIPGNQWAPLRPGRHTQEILGEFGISDDECRNLTKEGAIEGVGGIPAFKL